VIRSSERVVVISTANGLKFADQKAAYHLGALEGIKPAYRNKPVELPADPKRVARAIARHVEKMKLLVSS
jgi:threonine synthase